jgi:hypothetical protein
MNRLLLLVAFLVLPAVFPATGAAASRGARVLVAGPLKVRAYKMYLMASSAPAPAAASLTVLFVRGTPKDLQEHYYQFTHGVSVKIAANGRSATVRANLGTYGHVRMKFASAGAGHKVPGVCQGATLNQIPGTLAGRRGVAFASHSSYLRTVRSSNLPAYIATVRGQLNCKPQLIHGVTLNATANTPGQVTTNFSATRSARGVISEQFNVLDYPTTPTVPTIIHSVYATRLRASAFTFASNFSSAHAKAASLFLSGRLAFTQTFPTPGGLVIGTVAGNLAAHFDGIGAVSVPANANATLGRS